MNATVDLGGPAPTTSAYRVDGLEERTGHVPSTVMAFLRASVASDRRRLDEVLAPSLDVADHRQLSVSPIRTRGQMIDSLAAFGPNTFDIQMLALRGDVLAMFRVRIARTQGGVADILVVARCTHRGQMDRMVLHDACDVDGAVVSLDTLWGEVLAPDLRGAGAVLHQLDLRYRAEDVVGFAALMAPDMRTVDRRDGELMIHGRSAAIDMVWASLDGIGEHVSYTTEVHAVSTRGMVISHTHARVDELGLTEPDIMVIGVRDGLVDVLDYFDCDDLDTALERFIELG